MRPPVRLLFVIPHFFQAKQADATNRSEQPQAKQERAFALMATLVALRQTFGAGIYGLDHGERIAWQAAPAHEIDVVVCTAGDAHLLDDMPTLRQLCQHSPTTAEPQLLGFECHRLLAEARGRYDYYAYLEDDIVLTDPLFFRKRAIFDDRFGPEALLQPNRWEGKPDGAVQKLYVDYRLRPSSTAAFQDIADHPSLDLEFLGDTIRFERTTYPSAGCFFLSPEQLPLWMDSPAFRDRDVSYMSPLDSAATLSVMKTFRVYKPVLDRAWFLEVMHASPRWVSWAASEARLMPHSAGALP